jgi:hypothetical protein
MLATRLAMEKSWSLPVAQTLQRHTGSWKASLPIEVAAGKREPEQASAVPEIIALLIPAVTQPISDSAALALPPP